MPQSTKTTKTSIVMLSQPDSPASEAYRTLRINLDFAAVDKEVQTIAITSAIRDEGKTATALNLAAAYARAGKKVLLVDADLRKPSIHQAFFGDNGAGLTNLIAMNKETSEVVRHSPIENLSVITSGPLPPSPSELLASHRLDALLKEWKLSYDMILLDTPPSFTLMDARIVAAKCDGTLLVMEYGRVKRAIAKRVKDDLIQVKAQLLGVVLNKINDKETEAYQYQ